MFQKNLKLYLNQLEALLQQVVEHQRVNNIHDLRIVSRKLSAILWMIEQSTDLHFSKMKKKLHELTHVLGKRRQLDVLIKNAIQNHLDTSPLMKALIEKKKNISKQLSKVLNEKNQICLTKKMNGFLKKIKDVDERKLQTPLNHALDSWAGHYPIKPKELHHFRIKVKRLRYAMEALGCESVELKKIQQHLGRMNDLKVLASYFPLKKIKRKYLSKLNSSRRITKTFLDQATGLI